MSSTVWPIMDPGYDFALHGADADRYIPRER
jgi:hypothetical protein